MQTIKKVYRSFYINFKAVVAVIEGLVLDFSSLLCYCMIKYQLQVTLAQCATQDTLYVIWCLLSGNNIGNLLRIPLRPTKWVICSIPSLNLSSILFQKSQTQNYHSTHLRKGVGEAVVPKAWFRSAKIWVFCAVSNFH